MTKELTQHEKILIYLQNNGSITTFEAFEHLGITKLTTRISELRAAGFTIIGEKVKSASGAIFNRYSIPKKGS